MAQIKIDGGISVSGQVQAKLRILKVLITSSTTDFNLNTQVSSQLGGLPADITVTVQPGVVISSTSSGLFFVINP